MPGGLSIGEQRKCVTIRVRAMETIFGEGGLSDNGEHRAFYLEKPPHSEPENA